MCVLHIQEVQIYGGMKSLKCFLKVTESLKYIYYMSPLSAVKQRVVVLTVHIKKISSMFLTEFLTGFSKGKIWLLKW